MRRAALTLLLLALPPAAHAVPPVAGGTECELEVRKEYRQQAVLKKGLPVTIRCDGPARVAAALNFRGPVALQHEMARMFSEGAPGSEADHKGDVVFAEPGSAKVRLKFQPYAQRLARKFKRVQTSVVLFALREDGEWRPFHEENAFPALVR